MTFTPDPDSAGFHHMSVISVVRVEARAVMLHAKTRTISMRTARAIVTSGGDEGATISGEAPDGTSLYATVLSVRKSVPTWFRLAGYYWILLARHERLTMSTLPLIVTAVALLGCGT